MGITGKNALVVGGAGFIGSWIVEKMATYEPEKIIVIDNLFLGKEENLDEAKKHLGNRLKFFKCDATNYDMLKEILWREGPIDVVFNTAVKPLLVSFVDPVDVFRTSSEIVLNLLELQRKGYFDVLIHFSSSEAYGSAQYVPMDEKHALNPTTPYGAAKAATDLLALSYFITFGNDVRIIRPFNNYGPRQNEKTYAGVIPTTIKRILSGQPPIIFGDGEQNRDFT
ncbi:MAG: NAD-dependent epimerase/dehydratase family protein, partial [Candidatus Bathyarchaeia archaeon]